MDFQDGRHGCNFGFPIGKILAIFDLQVTLMLPTKFQLAFRFRSRSENKDFQDDHHGGYLGFPFVTIYGSFDQQITPMLPTKF